MVRYLKSEIKHVLTHIHPCDDVLELGCGYGRVLAELLESSQNVVGIDTSLESLELARMSLGKKLHLCQMDARTLGFRDNSFDKTICIQNGISAFRIEPSVLLMESVRVTRDGGTCFFSSYSDNFWEHRLEWFRVQSEAGLLGEIDWEKTRNGVIVCKDGFRATTFGQGDFEKLTYTLGLEAEILEVDESSVFCEVRVTK